MAGESILVVDNEESMRLLLSTYLDGEGYRVRTANDGLEALRALRAEPPDLVITDVNMPNVNGFELTRRLRTNRRTARIPIIMLSERKEAADVLQGYGEGADDYLPKPVELAILGAKVDALLRRAQAAGALEAQRGKVVLFLHGKGGMGTTTLAVNAAVALAVHEHYRVAVLDLCLEFGNAAMLLDLKPSRTLADLGAVSVAEVDDAVFAQLALEHPSGAQLVVGCNTPVKAELVTVATVQQTLDRLREQAAYVVVDVPPSFTDLNLAALDVAETVCLVAGPHLAALKATADCISVLAGLQVPANRQLLLLNRTTPHGLADDQIARFFDRKLDLVIPYTPQCDDAANAGRPLVTAHPANNGATKMRELAAGVAALVPAAA
jgi:pilus assembly protein CpaE